jgi:hypothetical protein
VGVPQAGQQVRLAQVDDLRALRGGRAPAVEDLDDALVLDRHAGADGDAGSDGVDETRVGQDEARHPRRQQRASSVIVRLSEPVAGS